MGRPREVLSAGNNCSETAGKTTHASARSRMERLAVGPVTMTVVVVMSVIVVVVAMFVPQAPNTRGERECGRLPCEDQRTWRFTVAVTVFAHQGGQKSASPSSIQGPHHHQARKHGTRQPHLALDVPCLSNRHVDRSRLQETSDRSAKGPSQRDKSK